MTLNGARQTLAIVVALTLMGVAASEGEQVGPMSVRGPEGRSLLPRLPFVVSGDGPLAWTARTPVAGGLVRYAHVQDPAQPSVFYVFGGVTGSFSATANSWKYDAATDTWTPLTAMPYAAEGPSATLYGGKIYVAGGGGTNGFNIYDIVSNTWSPGASLPRAVWGAAMGAWDGKVFLVGGDPDFSFGGTSDVVDVYDIATNTWTGVGNSMPTATVTSGYAQWGRYLYVVGGWGDASPASNVTATQRYDMEMDSWSSGPTFTSARGDLALVVTRTTLYALGGDADGGGAFDATNAVEALALTDWATGAWTADTALPTALTANNAGYCVKAAGGDGTALNLGGYTGATIVGNLDSSPVDACVLGLEATGLSLPGAGVLEPGAMDMVVETEWTNVSTGNPLAVTGAAISVGDFTVEDGTATYGDVGPQAVAPCAGGTDCYAVSADGVRPARHWDVTLQETLSTTETHDWVLHIGSSFDDVPPTNNFYRFVETILHNGVTSGCSATGFCPNNGATRAQMAVFTLTAREGTSYTPPPCVAGAETFSDVPATSPFCPAIEELARRGVVSGCGIDTYCPNSAVTRAQTAVFTLSTLEGSAFHPVACVPGAEMFADVPATSPFCPWVEEYARRGITAGCTATEYCPVDPVTRAQMAVFQTVTFDLALYRP